MAIFRFKIALIAVLVGSLGYTQTGYQDLVSKIQSASEDSVKMNLYLELSNLTLRNNPDSTILLSEQGLDLAKKIGNKFGEIKFLNQLGNVAQKKGEYDNAQEYYEKSIELSDKYNIPEGRINAMNNIGINYTYKADYPKAIEAYREAYNLELARGNIKGQSESLVNLGVVYYYTGELDKTLDYFKQSLAKSEEINDSINIARVVNNLGVIYYSTKELDSAMVYYERAIVIAKSNKDKYQESQGYHNVSTIHLEKKNYNEAIKYSKMAADLEEELGAVHSIAISYAHIGHIYTIQGNYTAASEMLSKAMQLSREHGQLENERQTENYFVELYKAQGNFKEALNHYEIFSTLSDSILNIEKVKAIEDAEAKYETAEKERQLAIEKLVSDSLSHENVRIESERNRIEKEKAESDLKVANRNAWIFGLGGGLLALLFVGLFIIQRNRRKAQAEKDAALIKERDKGLKAVIAAQEEERKRISKDLHDGIGAQLSGLKMGWQNLSSGIGKDNPEMFNKLMDLTKILDDTAGEVRNLSHQMMPKALSEMGLVPAINDMLYKALEHSNIKYYFDHHKIDRYDESVEIGLYRVCQELINNIIKHSGADEVSVQLFKSKEHLILMVEDNGVGMGSGKSNGHGIMNIRTRLNAVEGDVNYQPGAQKGTVATVKIKL